MSEGKPEKRAFADLVAAACTNASKQIQPPVSFCESAAYHRKMAEHLRSSILRSKRYILDDDVVGAAVDLGQQHPEILLAVLKNAMSPFDLMWLEWNPQAQIDASMSNTGHAEGYHASGGPAAGNCGAIIKRVGDTAYQITMVGECLLETPHCPHVTVGQYSCSPLAIRYDVQAPVYGGALNYTEEMVVRHTEWTPALIRSALMAGAYVVPVMDSQGTQEWMQEQRDEGLTDQQITILIGELAQTRMRQCDTLSSHAQWIFDPVFGKPFQDRIKDGPDPLSKTSARSQYFDYSTSAVGLSVQEEAGAFRFIISVIALMTGRDRLTAEFVTERGLSSKFHKGKLTPFLENRRVSLTVPRKIANRKIVRSLYKSMPRAEHDVEGHWKQRRKGYDIHCDHVMVWETPKREVCAIKDCGFKRWRVEEFTRGDASIGVIKKTRVAELDRKVKPIPVLAHE